MPQQNLISATIDSNVKQEILQKLAEVRNSLSFLQSLQTSDLQGLFKAGNTYAPFIEKAYSTMNLHADILPTVFDAEEFRRDYQLSKDLTQITTQINELSESLSRTLIAVNSDAMSASLEIYAAVKQHKDKVPGLNVAADEMAVFFKRVRKPAETTVK